MAHIAKYKATSVGHMLAHYRRDESSLGRENIDPTRAKNDMVVAHYKNKDSRSYYVNEALADSIDRFEYEYGILRDIEDYRAGRLETYSIDEVRAHCGLAD